MKRIHEERLNEAIQGTIRHLCEHETRFDDKGLQSTHDSIVQELRAFSDENADIDVVIPTFDQIKGTLNHKERKVPFTLTTQMDGEEVCAEGEILLVDPQIKQFLSA